MEPKQFEKLMAELDDIKALLILLNCKSGVKLEDVGKCIGLSIGRVSQIMNGTYKKKVK